MSIERYNRRSETIKCKTLAFSAVLRGRKGRKDRYCFDALNYGSLVVVVVVVVVVRLLARVPISFNVAQVACWPACYSIAHNAKFLTVNWDNVKVMFFSAPKQKRAIEFPRAKRA